MGDFELWPNSLSRVPIENCKNVITALISFIYWSLVSIPFSTTNYGRHNSSTVAARPACERLCVVNRPGCNVSMHSFRTRLTPFSIRLQTMIESSHQTKMSTTKKRSKTTAIETSRTLTNITSKRRCYWKKSNDYLISYISGFKGIMRYL